MDKSTINLDWLKRQAKNLKKEKNITHSQALEQLAKQHSFSNWQDCQRLLNKTKSDA